MPETATSVKETQNRRLERDPEAFGQNPLEFKRRLQDLMDRRKVSSRKLSVRPDNVQEDRTFNKIRKQHEAKNTTPENMSLWHSALLAAMVTTAIALFSAGMVFSVSGKDNVPGLPLELPQTIESFFWRNQKIEVKALPKSKKSRSLIEEAANEHEKDQTEPRGGELATNYQEEETRPAGEESTRKLSQEATEQEDKDPAYHHRIIERVPTLVVMVQKGDTISRILERQFGRSGRILMGAVRELNPEIEDLDWIRVGQKIRLPLKPEVADHIQTKGGRSGLPIEERTVTAIEQSADETQMEHTIE